MTILDKVYDRYEQQDFTPKSAHLNPVREINFGVRPDVEDAIYDKIRKRIEKIKNAITPVLEKPDLQNLITVPFAQRENNVTRGLPVGIVDAMHKSGGIRNGLLGMLGPGGESPFVQDPLMMDLELMLMMIPATVLRGFQDPFGNFGAHIDPNSGDVGPFALDCNGVEQDKFNIGLGANPDDEMCICRGEGCEHCDENFGKVPEDGEGGEHVLENDALLDMLIAQLEMNNQMDQIRDQSDLLRCAAKELGILKIILIILRIIGAMKDIVSMVLDIVMMIMDTVQLAAGAWLNPTNIAKIAQRLAQKLLAIAIGIIAELLGKLWEKLNLDCLISQVSDIIAQISAAISGIMSIYAEVRHDAISFVMDEWKNKIKDPFDNMMDTFRELREKGVRGILEEQWEGIKEAGSNIANQYKDPSFRANIYKQLIPPEAMNAVALAKDAQRLAQQIIAAQSTIRGTRGTTGAQMSKLDGLMVY